MKKLLLFASLALASGLMLVSCGVKINHDTPEGIVESYVTAENEGDAKAMVECLDLTDLEEQELEKVRSKAAEVAAKHKGHLKSFTVGEMSRDWVDYEYFTPEDQKGYGSLQVVQVDGKWYVTVRSTGLLY